MSTWRLKTYYERVAENRRYNLFLDEGRPNDVTKSYAHMSNVTIHDVAFFFATMGHICLDSFESDTRESTRKWEYAISFRITSREFGEEICRKTTQKQRLPTSMAGQRPASDPWINDLEFVFSPCARPKNRLSIRYRGKRGEFCVARIDCSMSHIDMNYASRRLFLNFFGLPRPFFADRPNWRLRPVVLKMSYERETFFATVPRDIIVYGVLPYLLSY